MKQLFALLLVSLFATSAFAKDGIYLEFRITSPSITGTSKTYTAGGSTRSEIIMNNPRTTTPIKVATLILASAPGKSYSLNEASKTYTEMDAARAQQDNDDDIEVTVLGKEKVNNYNCTHVSIKYKKSQRATEMWLSKDIPGFMDYTTVKNNYLGGSKFFDALKAKGADGFVARILTNGERGEKMQMDLVKAEKQNVPDALLSLDGYTKGAGSYMTPGGGVNPNAIQNMTPEERKAYIEKMRAQYKR